MRTLLAATLSVFVMGCATAQSRISDSYEDVEHARVVSIEPIRSTTYHRVPKTSCTTRTESSMITERCSSYQDNIFTSRTTGYKVMFEYRGTLRSVMMKHDPGAHVTLKVVTNVFVLE